MDAKKTPEPRPGLHLNKVLLCLSWNFKGIIHDELLNQNITKELYCEQLDHLKCSLKEKRPYLHNRRRVLFHQDSARPHVPKTISKKLEEFVWKIMSHPPYSPDLAPSDYYIFRSLQSYLQGMKMINANGVQRVLDEFFRSKYTYV